MNIHTFRLFVCILPFIFSSMAYAEPDYYLGDTNVYAGSTSSTPPNIMFFIDTSKQMAEIGSTGTYPGISSDESPYAGTYNTSKIYYKSNDAYKDTGKTLDNISNLNVAHTALSNNGNWIGCISNQLAYCTNKTVDYYTGDYLNWHDQAVAVLDWAASTAYTVGDLVYGSNGQAYKCTTAGISGGTEPFAFDASTYTNTVVDNNIVWTAQISIIEVVENAFNQTLFPFLVSKGISVGLMKYGGTQGGAVVVPVTPISNYTDADTALSTLTAAMSDEIKPDPYKQTANAQPLGSALWDAWLYWVGDPEGSSHANSAYQGNYLEDVGGSPISYWCQNNHMIVLATGATKDGLGTSNPLEILDDENPAGDDDYYTPEAAQYLYNSLDYTVAGVQAKVHTHIIQLMTSKLDQLVTAADNGHGMYVNVSDSADILSTLANIILALLEEDSSFVAPVVPASPESRAYSGQRIYLGFFKPKNDEPWYGNLKKFGLNNYNDIVGFNSSNTLVYATDEDGYFLTDADDNPTIRSFWSTEMDGGVVEKGGVGALLQAGSRNIYTYTEATTDLTNGANAFSYTNKDNLTTRLDLPITSDASATEEEKNQAVEDLIKYTHGYDAYGTYSSEKTAQRPWIMGDVMHSKPVFINYRKYNFTDANETAGDPRLNYGYVFVGSNDGMLHAFRDYNGSESWAFIPPDLLGNLQYLPDLNHHYYFVDNSPFLYVHDKDGDGNIGYANVGDTSETAEDDNDDDDKAILVFGLRRGGGSSTIKSGSQGSYYALDITDPESPDLLWQINSESGENEEFAELAQTWSLARVTSMYVNGEEKIVAIFGGGYNTNEDLRYGNTQTFPDDTNATTITSNASTGEGNVANSGSSSQYTVDGHGLGRGIYIVEVATVDTEDKSLDTTSSGELLWKYTYGSSDTAVTDTHMTFSVPSEPLLLDTNNNNYTDHIYIMDTGGQLWRFNVGDTDNSSNWTGERIFIANDATLNGTDIGRKVFYKGTATLRGGDTYIYIGTGDREHALNTAVVDRLYVIRDREMIYDTEKEEFVKNSAYPVYESRLVDVTDYTYSQEDLEKLSAGNEYSFGGVTYYGWFVRLNETDHDGEKVLASPKVLNNIVLYTTYQPATTASSDPCVGQLGTGRLYALDVDTGKAALNFNTENDTTNEETTVKTPVLDRSDRGLTLEKGGLPPEALVMFDDEGGVSIKVETTSIDPGISVKPIDEIYWMMQ
jgi:type IV pilus assembly protein PilY1